MNVPIKVKANIVKATLFVPLVSIIDLYCACNCAFDWKVVAVTVNH